MYVNTYRCVNCKKELSDNQRMWSKGRCPKCGHKGKDAGTIVDCVEEGKKVSKLHRVSEVSRILITGVVFVILATLAGSLLAYIIFGFLSDIAETYSKG